VADEKLSSEREARKRALAALLVEEREQTDVHLDAERQHADTAIASRDDFLAIVSHDLRNMLNGISMSAASLMNFPCGDEVQAPIVRAADRIQRYVVKMTRLVADLVDLASIEAGHLAVVPGQHETIELLREPKEVLEPIAATRGISIRTEVRSGSLLASYDHERILQVLANLVGNAIKFTPSGGTVDILAERADGHVRFSVFDTGRGIAPFETAPMRYERGNARSPRQRYGSTH
jgi:signal transduction histidine kinase